MFELKPASVAEEWLTLVDAPATAGALRVKMRPIGPSALEAARAALREATHPVQEFAKDAGFDDFCRELCRRGIVEWDGIGQGGKPAPLTRENIDALLSDPTLLARLQTQYVYPYLAREAEKNASAPSSPGTSPAKMGAKATARGARSAAKPAPISRTRRKPAKALPSGK